MKELSRSLACLVLLFLFGCTSGAPLSEPRPRVPGWNPVIHQVRAGDTLYSIAWWYQVDFRDLARWNQLAVPFKIVPGQELRVKTPPVFHPHRDRALAAASPSPSSNRQIISSETLTAKRQPLPDPQGTVADWIWPTEGKLLNHFSLSSGSSNKGVDISGRHGQSIVASAPGVVVYSGDALKGYGNLIIIKHSPRLLSAYAHNRRVLVAEGQQVRQGQSIAEMGTKDNFGPLLHFEIRRDGQPVDPIGYLPNRG